MLVYNNVMCKNRFFQMKFIHCTDNNEINIGDK